MFIVSKNTSILIETYSNYSITLAVAKATMEISAFIKTDQLYV